MAVSSDSLLTVSELLDSVGGRFFNKPSKNCFFTSVVIDSRNTKKGSLFIPLIGKKQDGHGFIEEAAARGASLVFAQNSSLPKYQTLYKKLGEAGLCIILTDNNLYALQAAARAYVQKFPHLQKLAVTGSSGKTTAKECIAAVLSRRYTVITNEGNLNSETGLPLSVFNIRADHQIGIFEMGMNRRGEIKELSNVLFPQTALITNIGTAHIGILGTRDAIAEEKKQVFSAFTADCTGFIPADDEYKNFLLKGLTGRIHTYGLSHTPGLQSVRDMGLNGSELFYEGLRISFPLIGAYNVQNALAAVSLGRHFGLSAAEIKAGLESLKPLFGRSQILDGSPLIIQDCYNANRESMLAAIDFFIGLRHTGKKLLILGDMLELGQESAPVHEEVLIAALASDADLILLVGCEFEKAVQKNSLGTSVKAGKKLYHSAQTDDAALSSMITVIRDDIDAKDLVLIKASRSIRLERIVKILREDKK